MKKTTFAGMAGLLAALLLPISAKAGGLGHDCNHGGHHAHAHHGHSHGHHARGHSVLMVWPGDAIRSGSVRARYSHRNPSPHEYGYHHGGGHAAQHRVVVVRAAPVRASVRYVAAAPIVLVGPGVRYGGGTMLVQGGGRGHGMQAAAKRSDGGQGGHMMMRGHSQRHR